MIGPGGPSDNTAEALKEWAAFLIGPGGLSNMLKAPKEGSVRDRYPYRALLGGGYQDTFW